MPVQKVNGIELEYFEYGAGDRYLLCSQQNHSTVKNYTIDLALKHGFHVFNIVIRGYGKSTHITEDLGDTWYDVWAQDTCDFADSMGIDKFFYTGVSHGGGIGWHICINHPERLLGYFGVVAGPHSKDGKETGSARMRTINAAKTDETWQAYCSEIEKQTKPVRKEGMSDEQWELSLKLHEESIAQWRSMTLEEARLNPKKPFPKQSTEKELIEVLSRVEVPTLLLGGMHDDICLPENLVRSCKSVKKSKMIIYEDASHGLDKEHNDEIVGDIVSFCLSKKLI